MKIQVSEQAAEDLLAGFQFYEHQEEAARRQRANGGERKVVLA